MNRFQRAATALSVTSNGSLYAAFVDSSNFDEYARGASKPTNTFRDGRYGAGASAVTR